MLRVNLILNCSIQNRRLRGTSVLLPVQRSELRSGFAGVLCLLESHSHACHARSDGRLGGSITRLP